MVLQANKPISVFGNGKGNLIVKFLGKTYEKFVQDERWVIKLDPTDYGGPYEMRVNLNGKEICLKNVMIGDVILCAGQSNMQFQVKDELEAQTTLGNENVRYYMQDRIEENDSVHSDEGWLVGNTKNIARFSALGYHIADEFNKVKNHAVGIVGCFQGASVIRSWMNKGDLTQDIYISNSDRHPDSTNKVYSLWNSDSKLYNYMFLPLAPFSFYSVIWYQGESNTSLAESKVYASELKLLISRWRKDLDQKDLAFVVVQICDFDFNEMSGWKAVQQAQVEAVKDIENAFLVTSSDVCEHSDIHPNDKRGLAKKIAKIL